MLLKLLILEAFSLPLRLILDGWRLGICTRITDGDTVKIQNLFGIHNCRLAEIDAPESKQEFGEESKLLLERLILPKKSKLGFRAGHHVYPTAIIFFKITGKDKRYNRLVVRLANFRCFDINKAMVKLGMAHVYVNYVRNKQRREILLRLEEKAKKKGLGLWQQANPTAPWDWRITNKSR